MTPVPSRRSIPDLLAAALLFLLAAILYSPVHRFEFLPFDDQLYVSQNWHVLGGMSLENLKWASTAIVVANWHPLTLITELLISSVFHPTPGAFHLFNALSHALNVTLVFYFIRLITGRFWPAVFTAAIWGLHPLRVESVAWVAELKDVLCANFFLAALIAYVHYTRRRTIWRYLMVLLLHALALLAKPMAVTFPFVLLLLDYWPLSQSHTGATDPSNLRASTTSWWTQRVLEILPLLTLSVADITYAIVTQFKTSAAVSLSLVPFSIRLQNAIVSLVSYLRQTIWPAGLSIFYPHPAMTGAYPGIITLAACAALLLFITLAAFYFRKQQPSILVGWLWFVGMMVPVLGFIQLGEQARADRYTYLPSVMLYAAVILSISNALLRRGASARNAGAGLAVITALLLACGTHQYLMCWENGRSLFQHGLESVPNNYVAEEVLTDAAVADGGNATALRLSHDAVMIAPISPATHIAYASALRASGDLIQAGQQLQEALKHRPNDWFVFYRYGEILVEQAHKNLNAGMSPQKARRGMLDAVAMFKRSLAINPDAFQARKEYANLLSELGDNTDAEPQWEQTLHMAPADPQTHGLYAEFLDQNGRLPQAIEQYWIAYNLGARNPEWEDRLAFLVATNEPDPAVVQKVVDVAKDACDQTHNTDPLKLDTYAAALARVGRFDDAVTTAHLGVVAATAQDNPRLSAQIDARLNLYRQGKIYMSPRSTTGPTESTRPTTGPVTTADPIEIEDIRGKGVVGLLGLPLGKLVVVSGKAVPNESLGKSDNAETLLLRITSVDGKTLPKPVDYPFRKARDFIDVASPKIGDAFEFRGYETGGYGGVPLNYGAPWQERGFYFSTEFLILPKQ